MISFNEYTKAIQLIESDDFYIHEQKSFTGYPIHFGVEDGKKVMIWRKPSKEKGKPYILFGTIVKKGNAVFLDLLGEGKHLIALRDTDLWNEKDVDTYTKFIDKLFSIKEFQGKDSGKEDIGFPFWGNAIVKTKHGYLIGDVGRGYRERFDYIRVTDVDTVHADSLEFPIYGMSSYIFREYMHESFQPTVLKDPDEKDYFKNHIVWTAAAYTKWNVSMEQAEKEAKEREEKYAKEEKEKEKLKIKFAKEILKKNR